MAHPHDKKACRLRRKCVLCNTVTHLICSGCSNPGQSITYTIGAKRCKSLTWI
jgi:hypothetical protein